MIWLTIIFSTWPKALLKKKKSQNNTGNTEGLMAQTPTVKLDLQRKKIKGMSVCGKALKTFLMNIK